MITAVVDARVVTDSGLPQHRPLALTLEMERCEQWVWKMRPPKAFPLHEGSTFSKRSADELLAASERRAPEVSIAAAFYNTQTGQTTTTTRATKTQKRKHQINSLAIAAAERELELMEKRGRATKTKAETNAKYGW